MARRFKIDPERYEDDTDKYTPRAIDTGCGKNAYGSHEEAEMMRQRRHEISGDEIAVYQCEECQLWHLTSKWT